MPKRCALGCPFVSGRHYHRFPHPVRNPDRFKEWVCLIGGKLDTQNDIDLYRGKVMCEVHFTDKDKNRNNRLNCLAVPSLHLNGKSDEVVSSDKGVLASDPVDKESSCSTLRPMVTDTSDRESSTQVFQSEPILDLPSDSNQYVTGLSDHDSSTLVYELEYIEDLPSESNHYLAGFMDITSAKSSILKFKNESFRNEPPESRQTKTVIRPDRSPTTTLKEHSYCTQDKKDIAIAGGSKYHQPTSLMVNQLQTARKKVKQLRSEISRLRRRNKIFKTRLINAKKNNKHSCLEKITRNMTAAAKIFTSMQFTQTHKSNKGRRFTSEGQELCLSIYKSNPQCYNLLSEVFTLPSVKTIKRLIRKGFDVQPGLNNGLDEGLIQPGTC